MKFEIKAHDINVCISMHKLDTKYMTKNVS